jgi:hypothetical protein
MGSERLFVLGWTYNLIKAGFDVSVVGLRILDCFSDGNVRSSFFFSGKKLYPHSATNHTIVLVIFY